MIVKLLTEHHLEFLSFEFRVYTCQNAILLKISCHGSILFHFLLYFSVFFTYKLVKSLREKQRLKDEKKKIKQQRKEKENSKKIKKR